MNVSTNNSGLSQNKLDLSDKQGYFVFLLIIAVAGVLRIYQLNSQMWLDEFSAILQTIRRPWLDIVTVYPGSASHVLYEVLANWSSSLFGESAWSVRLPAAIFGIAGVAVLAKFSSRIYTAKSGLFIAALMALSYNHIFFSQNARGYTALIFFFLWSSYLFIKIVESEQVDKKTWATYCFATVLTCYCQPFGVFIPASQGLIAVALTLIKTRQKQHISFPFKQFIYWMLAAAAATFLLYAPFINGMLEHARMNIEAPEEGPRFDIGLIIEIVEGLSAAFFGYVGLSVATIAGAVGVIIWFRSNPVSFFILLLPIIVQGLVFFIMGVGIHPRYFAIAIPVIYVAGGITFFYLSGYVLERIVSKVSKRQLAHSILLSVVVIVSAYPLVRYYSIPKQDYEGTLQLVEQLAEDDDIKAGIQTVGSIMTRYFGSNFVRIDTYDELIELEKSGKRIWVAMTLERIMEVADPELVHHIRDNYKLIKSFPGTVGDGSIQVYGKHDD